MRQAVQVQYQSITAIRVVETEMPRAGADELVVRVEGAGVNPVDWKLAEGYLRGAVPIELPYTPGCDVAGEIVEVGSGVAEWAVGDLVFGYPSLVRGGGYAEYVKMLPGEIARAPKGIPLAESAAYPVAAITAYEGLLVHGKLEAGMRLLVLGGAGGVGSAAVQLARAAGVEVYATASARNAEYLAGLGAKALDYGAGPLSEQLGEQVGGVDFIFDTVGGQAAVEALAALKQGGQFVSPVFPLPGEELLAARGARAASYGIQPSRERLETILPYIESGQLRIPVAAEFGLSNVVAALEASKTGRTRGKLLVRPALG
jgi:NADPH:quinone reductase-like Zn-dependent oxidoreductase